MKVGLLWYDDDPEHDLAEKVLAAAARYRQKFGQMPNLCFVHPSAFDGRKAPCRAGGVEIRPAGRVLKHHLWIGVADKGDPTKAGRSLVARVEAANRALDTTRQ